MNQDDTSVSVANWAVRTAPRFSNELLASFTGEARATTVSASKEKNLILSLDISPDWTQRPIYAPEHVVQIKNGPSQLRLGQCDRRKKNQIAENLVFAQWP